jgi:hypothetical protein
MPGFVKSFGFREVKELKLPVSKPMGLLWLTAAILFLTYGILHLTSFQYAWLAGLVAVVISQILVILFWKDARYGTIQRYLGEMVWFPSLALSPHIAWESLNDTVAKATMTYKGTTGSGTFFFSAKGEVTKFSALRYKGNEAGAKRYEWIMQIADYKIFEGIKVPANMTSTWKLEESDWTWLKLEVTDLKYNRNAIH